MGQSLSQNKKIAQMIMSAALAMGVFSVLKAWIPTPNYNLLNLLSILIACIGLVKVSHSGGFKNNAGYLLIGVGGWLCFMAKPTSAAILSFLVVIWLSISYAWFRQFREHIARGALLAALSAISLLLFSFLLASGSFSHSVGHLQSALENGKLLVGERWASTDLLMRGQLGNSNVFSIVVLAIVIAGIVLYFIPFLKTSRKSSISYELTKITAVITMLIITSAILFKFFKNPFISFSLSEQSVLIWATIGATLLVVLIKSGWSNISGLGVNRVTLAILFMLLPYAYAFGTTNNYYHMFAQVPIFGSLAIIFLIVNLNFKSREIFVFLIACLSLMIAFINVHAGVTNPYRQPSGLVSESFESIKYGRLKGIMVQKSVAEYLNVLILQANNNKLSTDTPVIDLTGASPGTLYALGAKSVGAPWLAGGYRGSEEFAIKLLLRSDPVDFEQSWLLIETNGTRSLGTNILSKFGKNLQRDYQLVAETILPKGLGGREQNNLQKLYKPLL